jgi:hypothetical protein
MESKLDWLLRWRKQSKEPCPFPKNEYVIVQDITLTPDIITRAVCNLHKEDYWRPLNLNHYTDELEKEKHSHSPEMIVKILHSITKLHIDEFGELEVWFDGEKNPSVSTAFSPGTFTRQLIELIEDHADNNWYYIEGVRYCSICRTRRCVRQVGGYIPCNPTAKDPDSWILEGGAVVETNIK